MHLVQLSETCAYPLKSFSVGHATIYAPLPALLGTLEIDNHVQHI